MLTTNYVPKKFVNVAAGQSIVVPWTAISPQQVKVVQEDGVTPLSASIYSVAELPGGGLHIIFASALTGTHYIVRDTSALQLREIGNQTAFDAELVEATWDYQMQVVQEQKEKLSRALMVPMGGTVGAVRMGSPGQTLMWGAGNTIVPGPDSADLAAAAGILEAAEAAAQAAPYSFSDVATLQATEQAFPVGALLTTRAEGFGYQVFTPTAGDPAHLTTASGMSLRVLPRNGAVDVRAFGAKGDGVTDDTAVFQRIADTRPNAVVRVPAGNYRLHEINCSTGILWVCDNGSGEVHANPNSGGIGTVRFTYNGAGGAGTYLFRWAAAASGETIFGGGMIGRPILNGMASARQAIIASSTVMQNFEVAVRNFTYAGMTLDSGNTALSNACRVDLRFVHGFSAATQPAHGIIMTGEPGNKGCTQHDIKTSGLIHSGNMVHMVGNCDNNRLTVHASDGLVAGATGHAIALYDGAVYHPRNNLIHYFCGSMYQSAGSFGNVVLFTPSEGQTFVGKLPHLKQLHDYVSGEVFSTPTKPILKQVDWTAPQMIGKGVSATLLGAGVGVSFQCTKAGGEMGAAGAHFSPDLTKGRITKLRICYATDTAAASATVRWRYQLVVTDPNGGFVVDLDAQTDAPGSTTHNGLRTHTVTITSPVAVTPGSLVTLQITRLPSNAADTHTGFVHLFGAGFDFASDGPTFSTSAPVPLPAFTP